MADIFGYEKPISSSGQVASADFALITVGGKNSLVQDVGVNYAQRVEEVTQVGDSQIYWLPGRTQGSLSITKLVGTGKFFEGWGLENCGVIASASVSLRGGGGGSKCALSGTGTLSFAGAVAESFSVKLGAQQQTIAESINIKIASLSAS
jgi:hypothetical protein